MPHSREVRATSHDTHDPLVVAAFAAGDLSASDRDLAADLVRSCSDCALLHDDLRALARATKAAPPPITTRPRDFRLTDADAARLRPGGWRRLVSAFGRPTAGLSRNLGVGLATLGLAGLLIGNVRIDFGPAAAPDAATSAAGGSVQQEGAPAAASRDLTAAGLEPVPAASAAPALALPVAGSSDFGPMTVSAKPNADGVVGDVAGVGPAASGSKSTTTERAAADSSTPAAVPAATTSQPLNLVFAVAIVVGLGLVAASLLRGRRTV